MKFLQSLSRATRLFNERRMVLSLSVALAFSFTESSHATLMISANPSLPLLFADVEQDTRVKVGAKIGFGVDVTKLFDRQPLAVGVFYQGFLFSDYGPLALNVNGLTITYFPFGSPLRKKVIDGSVNIEERRSSVYVKGGLGLAFFNFKDYDAVEFGASAIAFLMTAGLEYPLSDRITGGLEANYLTTFGGVSTASTLENQIFVGATGFIFGARITFLVD